MIPNERLQKLVGEYALMGDCCEESKKGVHILSAELCFETADALEELLTLRHEKRLLIENSERLADYLDTASEFIDPSIEERLAIDEHYALMKQVKGE